MFGADPLGLTMHRRAMVAVALGLLAMSCGGEGTTAPGDPAEAPGTPSTPTTPSAPPTSPANPDAVPSDVRATAGDGQREFVHSPLAQPLVVTVQDAKGRRLPGVNVAWAIGQGAGAVSDASTATDSAGQARTRWTLGPASGTQTVTATVTGVAPVSFTAIAEADSTAPRLVGYTMDRREVNVDAAEATVVILVSAADSGSGVWLSGFTFLSPRRTQLATCSEFVNRLEQGGKRSGTWRCNVVIRTQVEGGTWTLDQMFVRDVAGNERRYFKSALDSAGLPTTLTVTSSAADTVAPVLTALSFTPTQVDVNADSQTVTFAVKATDGGTGVRHAQVTVQSPSAGQFQMCYDGKLVDGTAADGSWRCTLAIPRGAEAGQWTVLRVHLQDAAGNYRAYTPAELRAAKLPAELTVVSATPDTVPPKLVGFSIAPATVNLTDGSRRVEFTMVVEDEGTGVVSASATPRPPGASSTTGCAAVAPSAGTRTAGTFRCAILLSEHGAAGEWELSVILRDAVGQSRYYWSPELKAAGFTSTVTVTR